MRIFLLTLLVLTLTACSKPYDKYVGYWLLESDRSDRRAVILEIRKEDKNIYLLNEDIYVKTDGFGNAKNETVLEITEKEELSINDGPFSEAMKLSSDGDVLRIRNKKYTRIDEKTAKTTIENIKACAELSTKYFEERKAIGFVILDNNPDKAKSDALKSQYTELQKKIPNCKFDV